MSMVLSRISAESASDIGDVVFVHGLDGHPRKTWCHNPDSGWLDWLDEDAPNICVWSLQYDAKKFSATNKKVCLYDFSTFLLQTLLNKNIGHRPLVFVSHSYGGLVVKKMLHLAATDHKSLGGERLVNQTKGVVFIATPHHELGIVALAKHLPASTTAVVELADGSRQLKQLNDWYRDYAPNKGIITQAYYETSSPILVTSDSADPNVPDVIAMALPFGHSGVCKPQSRDEMPYGNVSRLIADAIPSSFNRTSPVEPLSPRAFLSSLPRENMVALLPKTAGTPFEFHRVIEDAHERLFLAGQNLYFLGCRNNQKNTFDHIIKFLRQGGLVEILVCDPNHADAVSTWQWVTAEAYKRHLEEVHQVFGQWAATIQNEYSDLADRLLIRCAKFVPVSMMIVDPDRQDGYLVVTPNLLEPISRIRSKFLVPKEHDSFEQYWGAYDFLFHCSDEVRDIV